MPTSSQSRFLVSHAGSPGTPPFLRQRHSTDAVAAVSLAPRGDMPRHTCPDCYGGRLFPCPQNCVRATDCEASDRLHEATGWCGRSLTLPNLPSLVHPAPIGSRRYSFPTAGSPLPYLYGLQPPFENRRHLGPVLTSCPCHSAGRRIHTASPKYRRRENYSEEEHAQTSNPRAEVLTCLTSRQIPEKSALDSSRRRVSPGMDSPPKQTTRSGPIGKSPSPPQPDRDEQTEGSPNHAAGPVSQDQAGHPDPNAEAGAKAASSPLLEHRSTVSLKQLYRQLFSLGFRGSLVLQGLDIDSGFSDDQEEEEEKKRKGKTPEESGTSGESVAQEDEDTTRKGPGPQLPTMRLRRLVPPQAPGMMCFRTTQMSLTHQQVVETLEAQSGTKVARLQMDPEYLHMEDPEGTPRVLWMFKLADPDRNTSLLTKGLSLPEGERVRVRSRDDVFQEEHRAYCLVQQIKEEHKRRSLGRRRSSRNTAARKLSRAETAVPLFSAA